MVTAAGTQSLLGLGQWKEVPVSLPLSSFVFSLPFHLVSACWKVCLLVGSDLRTGEGILEEESSFLSTVFFGTSHVYPEVR